MPGLEPGKVLPNSAEYYIMGIKRQTLCDTKVAGRAGTEYIVKRPTETMHKTKALLVKHNHDTTHGRRRTEKKARLSASRGSLAQKRPLGRHLRSKPLLGGLPHHNAILRCNSSRKKNPILHERNEVERRENPKANVRTGLYCAHRPSLPLKVLVNAITAKVYGT